MSMKYVCALSALLLMLFTSCGKKEETPAPVPEPAPTAAPAPEPPPVGVQAGMIALGKAIGPDKKVTTPTDSFAKGDTFYASVDTVGTGTATLKAKWTYHMGGKVTVVKEDPPQTINPTGPATTEFHVSKPGGWPAGQYQVELFLDDKSIGVRTFNVT